MNFSQYIKIAILSLLIYAPSLYAVDANVAGNVPIVSALAVYPQKSLDFSSAGKDVVIAQILIENNAPEYNVFLSALTNGFNFCSSDETAIADGSGCTRDILSDLGIANAGSFGTVDQTATGYNAVVVIGLDETADAAFPATGGTLELASAAGNAASNITTSLNGGVPINGGTTAPGPVAVHYYQTDATVGGFLNIVSSWNAGATVTGAAATTKDLLAGTYTMPISVTMESTY